MTSLASDTDHSIDTSVRDALLDTAERMFSINGFDGVSLRELTRQAKTNLAAVNYHFGSKEKLFEEVILRRLRPINEQRLIELKKVLDRAGGGMPSLADVLDAFARTFVVGIGKTGGQSLRQIMVRLFMESDPLVKPIIEREFVPVARQFRAAAARACPKLSQADVDFGLTFFVGAMVNIFATERRRAMILPSTGPAPTNEETLQTLIRFGVAGFAGLHSGSLDRPMPTQP